MLKCTPELKLCPLRGLLFVIGVIFLLFAMLFIYYFMGVFMNDFDRYSRGSYYKSFFEDQHLYNFLWNNVKKNITEVYEKTCEDVVKFSGTNQRRVERDKFSVPTKTNSVTSGTPPRRVRGQTVMASDIRDSLVTASSHYIRDAPVPSTKEEHKILDTASVASFWTQSSAGVDYVTDKPANWSWTRDSNGSAILNGTASPPTTTPVHFYAWHFQNGTFSYKRYRWRDEWGPPPIPSSYNVTSLQGQQRAMYVQCWGTRNRRGPGQKPWQLFLLSRYEVERSCAKERRIFDRRILITEPWARETPLPLALRVVEDCEGAVKRHSEPIIEMVDVIRLNYVESADGRLHVAFMVLDLIVVLFNGLLGIASYMLAVGARRKNRVFMLPWICISGVSVYGGILYALGHVMMEHGMASMNKGITTMNFIIAILVVVLHVVTLWLINLFFKKLFSIERRRLEG